MPPVVSVCMPARNAGKWLTESVRSILMQTYHDLELIVVDDGSTDSTLETITELSRSDDRLRVFSSTKVGVVAARKQAYGEARGDLVANMDADDIALPHRLEAQVEAMNTGLDLCGTQFDFLFDTERRMPRRRLPLTQEEAFIQMFRSNPISNPSVMFRRSTFGAEGLPYNASYVPSADYELWSRLLRDPAVRFANLAGVHMLYRAHRDQMTKPGTFANRVAAARVRLNLVTEFGLAFDDLTIRELCAPSHRPHHEESVDTQVDQELKSLAESIFGPKLQEQRPVRDERRIAPPSGINGGC